MHILKVIQAIGQGLLWHFSSAFHHINHHCLKSSTGLSQK